MCVSSGHISLPTLPNFFVICFSLQEAKIIDVQYSQDMDKIVSPFVRGAALSSPRLWLVPASLP